MIPGRARPATVGTRLLTTPDRKNAAGVMSLCHEPTVVAKGTGFPSGHPSGRSSPVLPQTAIAAWVPAHAADDRLGPSACASGPNFFALTR